MTRARIKPGGFLDQMGKRLSSPRSALTIVGMYLVSESQGSFAKQGFGGKKWAARGNPNVYGIIADLAAGKAAPPKRRFESRPVLRDTDHLASSIAFQVKGDVVEVGSNVPYASVHQKGGRIESKTISKGVQDKLAKWLSGPGKPHQKKLGWLLSPSKTGKKLKGKVEARPFLGLTRQMVSDIKEMIADALTGRGINGGG